MAEDAAEPRRRSAAEVAGSSSPLVDAVRFSRNFWFRAPGDGWRNAYAWLPEADAGAVSAVVVLLHGYGEHALRYQPVGEEWAKHGVGVYAIDHAGPPAQLARSPRHVCAAWWCTCNERGGRSHPDTQAGSDIDMSAFMGRGGTHNRQRGHTRAGGATGHGQGPEAHRPTGQHSGRTEQTGPRAHSTGTGLHARKHSWGTTRWAERADTDRGGTYHNPPHPARARVSRRPQR